MSLTHRLVEQVAEASGESLTVVQRVLSAVERGGEWEIVFTAVTIREPEPCRSCRTKTDPEALEDGLCAVCQARPVPDDRDRPKSVRTVSGGLPTLGRRRR
jgi:hypothetical protein